MRTRRGGRALVVALGALFFAACTTGDQEGRQQGPSTLVIGIDVSGSFRDSKLYDDAVDFAAQYIVAHLQGAGGLKTPTALFVGSVGGSRAGEPKAFHPINDFQGLSAEQVAADIRTWFPPTDEWTDFNTFFTRVAGIVKERGLILAPLNVVVLSDGVPDLPPGTHLAKGETPYQRIDIQPLEYLSRSVTVRLLYASPTVGDQWKRQVKRKRVRMWTEEAQVMTGWHAQFKAGVPVDQQTDFLKWVNDNVDFRVRGANIF
ncbi:MAG TPA: hypothetical protein VJN62_16140 [Gemmatimonadales bacterium]|nr:hypothetical protein [Gemmatimonadales bacterium]